MDRSKSHSPIEKEDINLFYSSGVLSDQNPTSLQLKVYFELSMHFARRGREGLRELKRDDLIFKTTSAGWEYCTLRFNPLEKNHPVEAQKGSEHDQRMYATNTKKLSDRFPEKIFSKIASKMSRFFPKAENLRF